MAFYGVPDLNNLKPENVKIPVIAFFGKEDEHKGFADQEVLKHTYIYSHLRLLTD
jgi:hypothetical protein